MILRKKTFYISMIIILLVVGGWSYIQPTLLKKDVSVERVILITIDTLRADHLGSYGYVRNTSPFFDRIAKHGVLFKNAFAPMATTAPSHASLFTSLYPIQHGVLKNGHKLDDSFVTMAETFQEMGYKTAGIVSTNRHFEAGNIHQGFEYFDEPDFHKQPYRTARETINTAIKWLDTAKSNENIFLWIHLFDPHEPLQAPPFHFGKLVASSDKKQIATFWLNQQHTDGSYFDNDQEAMFKRITQYDAEIHYTDSELQRFYHHYQRNGFDNRSVWIVTADHGEGLGNHNLWGHGKNIYNEQLRVPLVFYFSSGASKGRVIEHVVENVDIFPTIIELVKGTFPLPDHAPGESLLSLLFPRQHRTYQKIHAFSQRRLFSEESLKKIYYEEGEKYAFQSKEYKYVYRTEGTDYFFNLQADPYEVKNLINSESHEEKKLRDALLRKIGELKRDAPTEPFTVDKEVIERLRSLGYIQ